MAKEKEKSADLADELISQAKKEKQESAQEPELIEDPVLDEIPFKMSEDPAPKLGNSEQPTLSAEELAEFKKWKEGGQQKEPEPEPIPQTITPAKFSKLGPNPVHAKRGQADTWFSQVAWKGIGGDNNREGWKKVVNEPPEVQALKK